MSNKGVMPFFFFSSKDDKNEKDVCLVHGKRNAGLMQRLHRPISIHGGYKLV